MAYRGSALLLAWLAGTAVLFLLPLPPAKPPIVLAHWANVYMTGAPTLVGEPALLPTFAQEFNAGGHMTASGRKIEVQPMQVNSGVMQAELLSRLKTGNWLGTCIREVSGGCPDLVEPTIITPASEHWISQINYAAADIVVDTQSITPLATSYLGIAMPREMARCLGWPSVDIGFADIVALRADPSGWASHSCARAEWGKQPVVVFSDPATSSGARNVLYSLYAVAAGKPMEQLTPADVADPKVAAYVKQFQSTIDHYVGDTEVAANFIHGGPRSGHFFFLPENQVVTLSQGKAGGRPDQPFVMIYPKEGTPAYRHSAGIVRAPWVSPDHVEAARQWIAYLREDAQQRRFVAQGFRPATNVPYDDVISPNYGVDPTKPTNVVYPDRIDPAAAAAAAENWGEVKKPGVLMFVVDTSTAMAAGRMGQARASVERILDGVFQQNLAGLLTFSGAVERRDAPRPIAESRFDILDPLANSGPSSGRALYDAIREAVDMADTTPVGPDAVRSVVVFTGGQATTGMPLEELVSLVSTDGKPIAACTANGTRGCVDGNGNTVDAGKIVGTGLAQPTAHRVQVFFVPVGDGATEQAGQLLAQATASVYDTSAEKVISAVIARFSRYL